MITKRVLIVLNDLDNMDIVLKRGFEEASLDASIEVLYVYEKEHYSLKDLFFSDDDNSLLDKEQIKKEIKEAINRLNVTKDVAIFVYAEDTEDRVATLLGDDKDAKVVIGYHNEITIRVLKEINVEALVVKGENSYDNAGVLINSKDFECINRAKERHKNVKLMYDYRYIADSALIDPSLSMDYEMSEELEEIELKVFNELKADTNLDGEFFINGVGELEIDEYINANEIGIVYVCENFKDIIGIDFIFRDILNNTKADICVCV